jgi:hypothetical protein
MAKKHKIERPTRTETGEIDPAVLKSIAADSSAPASARVAAAKALGAISEGERAPNAAADGVTRRTFLPLKQKPRSSPTIAAPEQPVVKHGTLLDGDE